MTVRIHASRALPSRARRIVAGLVLGGALGLGLAGVGNATPDLTLKSTSVQLPDGTESFPAGPGLEAMNNNCVSCHSPAMVLNQPPLAKAVWETEVKKMMAVYKAPVEAKDVDDIIGYLVATKGAK